MYWHFRFPFRPPRVCWFFRSFHKDEAILLLLFFFSRWSTGEGECQRWVLIINLAHELSNCYSELSWNWSCENQSKMFIVWSKTNLCVLFFLALQISLCLNLLLFQKLRSQFMCNFSANEIHNSGDFPFSINMSLDDVWANI